MTAYGYVRKSVVADASNTLSPEVQEERIRALAAAHGDDDVRIVLDLDVSGAKVEERRGYMELVAAIESGEAHAVYAYDLSRLHRNLAEATRFFDLARERDVPVRLVADSIDTASASGRLMLNVLGAMNQWTSEVTSEKIKASLRRREETTDKRNGGRLFGSRPSESVQAVIDAFKEGGSYTSAARLLNERGTPTRNEGSVWHATSVKEILSRVAPDMLAPSAGRGSKAGPRSARFARLLRCGECGSLMTPSYDRRHDYMRYYCHAGSVTPHGRKTVPEAALLPAFEEEMSRAKLIVKRLQRGDPRDEEKRADIEKRRERLSRQHEVGLLDDAALMDRVAGLLAEEAKLATRRMVKQITFPVGVEDDPARVNAYLARLIDHVVVGMSKPERRGAAPELEFVWRDASFRSKVPLEDEE